MLIKKNLKWLTAILFISMSLGTRAASLSPTSLMIVKGATATVTVSNIKGSASLVSSNNTVISAKLSSANGSGSIQVTALGIGATKLSLKDQAGTTSINVTVINTNISGNTEGRLLASNCFQCHGTYGSGGFDSLLGKQDIYSELQEYLGGQKDPNNIMTAHVKGYTPEQLKAIADYLANP
jgi:cytochrome c553